MKNVLYFLLIFVFVCEAAQVNASVVKVTDSKQKVKTIDKDKRKKPNWINSIKKDYVIVTGSGATLEASQENALLKVKENIVRSVAENVKVSSEMTTKEEMGTNINNFFQSFEQTTQTQTAEMNFIKGIGLNKAEDYWWEKVQAGNNITFYYYLLYPFSEMELRKLVMAFEKADRELTEQLEEILNRIENVTVVEEMESDITTLTKLKDRFVDQRKTKAEVGIERIKSRIKSINIVPVSSTLGSLEYELRIGQKVVTTNKKPRATNPTKCATVNGIEPSRTGWNLTFDAKYCYDDPKNLIKVEHSFKYGKVTHEFYFDINEGKVEVYMHAPIMISAAESDDTKVLTGKVTFTLSNKFDGTFMVDRIVLNYAKAAPIVFDNIGKTLIGKGDHSIILDLPTELEKAAYSSKTAPLVDGFIYYNVKGEQKTYKLYQNKVTTTW
ncbi:MAG: hypothetical protein ACOX0M_02595 [Salinivirgaceae bacterium]|jgi:hypothetical protein|nr:hypothetical protein [Bacteroidales bacterium]